MRVLFAALGLHVVVAVVSAAAAQAGAPAEAPSSVFLPGTQPLENGIEFAKVEQCRLCHADTKNGGAADPMFGWQGGMMSQAARDPIYRAALAIANQDVPGVGEFCVRCHAPRGWLEGRSKAADGSMLTTEDLHGVSCDVCHRLVDPLSPEAKQHAKDVPPGLGNAMLVVDAANVVRGPYGDGQGAMPHGVMKSPLHAGSALCGNCHDVSNPLQAADVRIQPPHAFGVIERTYSEWLLSDYAKQGEAGTCQSCHLPPVPGGGLPARFSDKRREHFVPHGEPGGSTWVQEAVVRLYGSGRDVSRKALAAGVERSRAMLRTAAAVEVSFPGTGTARVRVTNVTGHKLPTGYPEGRRMWLNLTFFDADGREVGQVGRYGDRADTLAGAAVTVPTLLDPDATRVYEAKPAISAEQAARTGKPAGPSFHFVLNDAIAKDNRIPPKGSKNAAFAERGCAPVGATYADGQHWDDSDWPLPAGTAQVRVRLMYQSMSWEYLKFLVEENRTDDWGKRLYGVWTETSRCPPEVMAEIDAPVRPS